MGNAIFYGEENETQNILGQSLQEFERSWNSEEAAICKRLKDDRPILRGKIIDIFNRATLKGKASLWRPWGTKRGSLIPLFVELDRNGFPGAPQICSALKKFEDYIVMRIALSYLCQLDGDELYDESFERYSQISNDECEENNTSLNGQKSSILIPGLPNEVSISCIAKVPLESWGSLLSVSKGWLGLFTSGELYKERKKLLCQEKVLLAEFYHFQKRIIYIPEKDCWGWFPKMKIFHKTKMTKKYFGLVGGYGDILQSSTIQLIGPSGKEYTFKIENGRLTRLKYGAGKLLICYILKDSFQGSESFVIVDLKRMESIELHSITAEMDKNLIANPMNLIVKDGKLYSFGYGRDDFGDRVDINNSTIDLTSGIMELTPSPYGCHICGLICGRIFAVCVVIEEDSFLSVKYYNEESNDWVTVQELLRKDGPLRYSMRSTGMVKVRVIENKLYILHQFVYKDDEADGDKQPWFIHIFSVSVENEEISGTWELRFSRLRDPKGNSPSDFDLINFIVIEL